ncbi:hypothetical protein Lal_00034031 [Lupinus albus]|nr:hypothetical protein Lal_00034031 [Lupinus albus]
MEGDGALCGSMELTQPKVREKTIVVLGESRLGEKGSPGRVKSWTILESRLGEKWHFGTVETVRFSLEREAKLWLEYISKCVKFEMGLRPELRVTFGHEEISDFPTLVNKCRMSEDNVRMRDAAAFHYGPQRNFSHGKGKGKVFQEERKPYSPPTSSLGHTSHGPKTHTNAGGSRLNSQSLFTWEGEIQDYTGGFSPERELSRLGEKWYFGIVEIVRFSLEREGQI